MTLPEPNLVGGRPVVIGSIVHWARSDGRACIPVLVLSADGESVRVRDLADANPETEVLEHDESFAPGSWHWPVVDRRGCQGLPR